MRLGVVPMLMTIGILSGCGDATGPVDDPTVTINVTQVFGPYFDESNPTQMLIQCGVALRASTSGKGRARWFDAKLYIFAGADRTAPLDSATVPASQVQDSWGAPDIDAYQARTSAWDFKGSVPFGIAFVYRYGVSGAHTRTARAEFTCGPTIPSGSPPPTLTAVTLQPTSGELESGDTLAVSYTASSSVGLWKTDVIVSGACNFQLQHQEKLAPTVTRTEYIRIPSRCTLGATLNVELRALDAALRTIGMPFRSAWSLVDRTRPEVGGWFNFAVSPTLGPHLFAGDTIHASIGAGDNNILSAAFWDVAPFGYRDSVRWNEQSLSYPITIPVPLSWTGKLQFKLYSRDAAGLMSDTLATPPESVRVYPTLGRTLRVSKSLSPLRHDVRAMTLDQRRNIAWVIADQRVYGVALASMLVTDTITYSGGWDLDMSAGGDSLIVLTLSGIGVVDLSSSPRVMTEIPISGFPPTTDDWPERVRVAANGKIFVRLYRGKVLEADLAGTSRVRTDAGVSGVVGGAVVERSLDHRVLILNGPYGLQRYVSASDRFEPGLIIRTQASGITVDASGARIAIGSDLFDGASQFQRRMETPSQYSNVPAALSPDGRVFYHFVWPQGILSGNADDGRLADRTRLPFQTFYMRMFPDGTKLVFIDAWEARVGVMELP